MYFVYFVVTFILPLLFLSCAQPTDSSDNGTVERERIEVSGSISEDTVWESGKEYVVTGDVTVEAGATLTLQPDVGVKFTHERPDDYYGITVEGTLIADGDDSTTAILFTPLDKLLYPTGFTSGAAEWARKPGDWRGIDVEASSDSSSVMRYCRIEYANVGSKADGSSPPLPYVQGGAWVRYGVVEQYADGAVKIVELK